ncbi:MAG: PAS domain S-box protein [Oligoflexia bacterium]|nr:PAS domain S-box protein [Oligoflexia bacterium]
MRALLRSSPLLRLPTWVGPTLLLAILGYAANWLKLEIFFNVDFVFGSIFVMIAILRYGMLPGAIVGFLAATCTLQHWNHPWALLTFTLEALFVGRHASRSGSFLRWDILFWLFVGGPLVWVFYHHVMGMEAQATLLVFLKQSVNGIFNALIASLIVLVLPGRLKASEDLRSFREITFVALATFALVPATILLVVGTRHTIEEMKTRLAQRTSRASLIALEAARLLPDTSWSDTNASELRRVFDPTSADGVIFLSLLDRDRKVLLSTRPDAKPGEPLPQQAGSQVALGGGIRHLIPPAAPRTSFLQRWRDSLFVQERSVPGKQGWIVVSETTLQPLLATLTSEGIRSFGILLLLILVTIEVANLISGLFSSPLVELQRASRQLPDDVLRDRELGLPRSRIAELDGLISNFRSMAQALTASFAEERRFKETLEDCVIQRTEELQQSEEKYRALIESANDLIFLIAINSDGLPGVLVEVNEVACQRLGYARQALLRMTPWDLESAPSGKRIGQIMETLRQAGCMVFDTSYLSRDGEKIPLEMSTRILTLRGKPYILALGRDLSERAEREALRTALAEEKTRLKIMDEEKRHLTEKQMLVKDLHDGIGGIVTNITMLAQYGLAQGRGEEALGKIAELGAEGITEIRSFMNGTESDDTAWSDLIAEIKNYAIRMLEPHGIQVQVIAQLSPTVPPLGTFRYVQLLRIFREGITNVIKHAAAKHVVVSLEVTPDRYELRTTDDGVGFDSSKVRRRGIANMHSRAQNVGATLVLDTSSAGTAVVLSWTRNEA